MTNEEMAREFQTLGIEWRPGMLSAGNVRMIARGYGVTCPDGEKRNGWHVADGHGHGLIWFAADGHGDLDAFDLRDPLTLAGIELQVREIWRELGALATEVREQGDEAGFCAYMNEEELEHDNPSFGEWEITKASALLAAARSAKEAG